MNLPFASLSSSGYNTNTAALAYLSNSAYGNYGTPTASSMFQSPLLPHALPPMQSGLFNQYGVHASFGTPPPLHSAYALKSSQLLHSSLTDTSGHFNTSHHQQAPASRTDTESNKENVRRDKSVDGDTDNKTDTANSKTDNTDTKPNTISNGTAASPTNANTGSITGKTHPAARKSRPRFPRALIERMEKMYKKNRLPSAQEKRELVKTGLITSDQVKKWFANKRCRDKEAHQHQSLATSQQLKTEPTATQSTPPQSTIDAEKQLPLPAQPIGGADTTPSQRLHPFGIGYYSSQNVMAGMPAASNIAAHISPFQAHPYVPNTLA